MPNRYQIAKGRKIAAMLLEARGNSTLSRHQLAKVASLMSAD